MCGSFRSSRWLAAALLVFLTSTWAVAEHHERKRVEQAEILALEQQWKHAQLSENIPEMDHLLSDNFLGILASGEVVTKVQQLNRIRSRQLCITQLDISDTRIKISGNLAVVTSLAKLDGTSQGRPLSGYFRYTQIYQRKPGDGWKITNFEATRVPADQMYGMNATSPGAALAAPPATAPSSAPASPAESGSPLPPS